MRIDPHPKDALRTVTATPRAATAEAAAAGSVALPEALLQRASEAARAALDAVSSNLRFMTDPHSGRTVVQVVDARTHQVIRQLPSEEALAITRAIDRLQSLLVRERA
jgi:flagellar protein FlaG